MENVAASILRWNPLDVVDYKDVERRPSAFDCQL
jgi:hypothetical protein